MTAKRLSTRLTSSLVLVAAVAPWAMGEIQPVSSEPVWQRVWAPNLRGLDIYSYYPPSSYYPPLYPPIPMYVVPPWPYVVPDWYYHQPYRTYVYPRFHGYYAPNNYQGWYYYWYNQPRRGPGWDRYWRPRDARPNAQAPMEVPRSR